MSLKKNIDKIILRENEIEQLLVNSSNLKQSELVELSKELSDIKPVTDLAKKKDTKKIGKTFRKISTNMIFFLRYSVQLSEKELLERQYIVNFS